MNTPPFIRLYGGPLVATPAASVSFTPIQSCLLALACVEPEGALTRERITWLLWEDGEDRKKRHSIRQLIYSINTRAEMPVLERAGEAVVPLLPTDLEQVDPTDAPPLARLATSPTPSFERWLDGARERLRRGRTRRLLKQLDLAIQGRDVEAVESNARCLANLREGGVGPLLDLAWALQCAGSIRSASFALREGLEESWLSELDRAQVARALRALEGGHSLLPSQGRPKPEKIDLLGRSALSEELRDLLAGDRPGSLVLFGPSGIGKTALLWSAVQESLVRFPLRPLIPAFGNQGSGRGIFRLCEQWLTDPQVLAFLESKPAQLTPLLKAAFPRLREHVVWTEPTFDLDAVEPDLLAAEFADLLCAFADGQSAWLVVDDLDLADGPSLELVTEAIGHRAISCRLLGTVTADNWLEAKQALRRLAPKLPQPHLVEIPELEREASMKLMQAQALEPLSTHRANRIFRALGGIPGYLVEAAKNDRGSGTALPQDAAQLVESRIAGLTPSDRYLCSLIAVAANETPLPALERLSLHRHEDLVVALDRLVGEGILERRAAGFWFRQAFMATGMYERLSEGERTSLHKRALETMLDSSDAPFQALERHASGSGEPVSVIYPMLYEAAGEAERRGALSEAARLWSAAEAAAPVRSKSVDALIHRVDVLIRLRSYDEASGAVSSGLVRVAEAPDGTGLGHLLSLRALLIESLTDPRAVGLANAEELIQQLESSGFETEAARALDAALGVADFQEDRQAADRLLSRADLAGPSSAEAKAWVSLARTRHLYLGNPLFGIEAARAGVAQAEVVGSSGIMARALNRLIVALVFRGLLASQEGVSVLKKARETARACGDSLLLYDTFVNEGSWLMDIGELAAAEETFHAARELVASDMSHQESLTTMVNRGELLIHLGRGAEALEEFRSALAFAGEVGAGRHLCSAGLALATLELGQLRASKEWIEEIALIRPTARFRGNLSLVALARARVAQASGQRNEALDTLLSFAREMLVWMVPAALKLYLEAFKLSIRWKIPLDSREVDRVSDAIETSGIPGIGPRILALRPRLPL